MKLKWIWLIILLIGLGITLWMTQNRGYTGDPFVREEVLLDTFVKIKAYGGSKARVEKAADEALAEVKKVEDSMNFFDPKSEISRINRAAGKKAVEVSDEVLEVISLSKSYGEETAGAFDIAVGPLIPLWGFGENPRIPSQSEIDRVLPLVNLEDIEIDGETKTVLLKRPGMMIDLGGVAKGYAADKAIETLKKRGVTQALITTGSTTRVLDSKPDGEPWRIGIEHPRKSGQTIGILNLVDKSVSTSGDYQRYFIKDGKRYHHILDPKTGKPAGGVMSITVVAGRSCAEADILSTAIFVMGYPRGMSFIEKTGDLEGVLVTSDGRVHVSSGLKDKVEDLQKVI